MARGGWVKAAQTTPGLSGEVATTTDTVMSANATYLGWKGIQPFFALSANLPTGKTAVFGTAANARMDPDFVDISTFGEGYNLGPSFGFNVPLAGSLLFTTSVGYTWRDRFKRESGFPTLPQGVDPRLVGSQSNRDDQPWRKRYRDRCGELSNGTVCSWLDRLGILGIADYRQ